MNSDDKRIGRNIKAIRNANNKNYLEFAEIMCTQYLGPISGCSTFLRSLLILFSIFESE